MSFLKNNLDYIADKFGHEAKAIIKDCADESFYQAIDSRTGALTLKYDNNFIHSSFNPIAESKKKLASLNIADYDLLVFYGFGLGYDIAEARAINPHAEFIIIEPSLQAFASTLFYADFKEIVKHPKNIFLLETQIKDVLGVLAQYKTDNFLIIKNLNLLKINPEYYQNLDKEISDLRHTISTNKNTAKKFKKLWIKNTLHNLVDYIKAPNLEILKDRFKGLPAVVLGAGPSLNKVLPYVKEIQEKTVIIAVDTALRGLSEHNIVPDFFLISDPQYWNIRHLDNTNTEEAILISSSEAVRLYPKNKFALYSKSTFPVSSLIEDKLKEQGYSLRSGGSVITSAWDLANLLGCSYIYLAGIDFAYPKGHTHYSSSRFETLAYAESGRLGSYCTKNFAITNAPTIYMDIDYAGNFIKSDKRLSIYKWWFERQFKNTNHNCFNLESDGLKIENLENVEIEKILKHANKRSEIDKKLKSLKQEILIHKENSSSNLLEFEEIIDKELSQIKQILENSSLDHIFLENGTISRMFMQLNLENIRSKQELLQNTKLELEFIQNTYNKTKKF